MLNVSVANKLSNGQMLVVAKDFRTPNNPKEYYSVKEEKVNTFIKDREALDFYDRFQNALSIGIGVIFGAFAGLKTKSNMAVKGIVALASGFGLFKGAQFIDKKLSQRNISAMLKRNDAQDVTKEMISKQQ